MKPSQRNLRLKSRKELRYTQGVARIPRRKAAKPNSERLLAQAWVPLGRAYGFRMIFLLQGFSVKYWMTTDESA
jgi:hypothetical protein